MYYTIKGSPSSWTIDKVLETDHWYQVEIKQSKRNGKGQVKKLFFCFCFFISKLFQFLFEIIIENKRHQKAFNRGDTGYDNVKIFLSIDKNSEDLGCVFVKEVEYTEGKGQVQQNQPS